MRERNVLLPVTKPGERVTIGTFGVSGSQLQLRIIDSRCTNYA